jgi:hypothetical protein
MNRSEQICYMTGCAIVWAMVGIAYIGGVGVLDAFCIWAVGTPIGLLAVSKRQEETPGA